MTDWMYSVLSFDAFGLLLGLALLALGFLLWKGVGTVWSKVLGVLLATGGLVLTVSGGLHLHTVAKTDRAYPAPGTLVDIGGYDVHVLAEGPQSPITIVWFGGGHGAGLSMFPFHRQLRDEWRSVLIDRPGTGWSDTGPFPRSTAREAEEMMAALDAAGEEGPFLFAGHSFGGLLAANMARRNPDVTAGVALLDPTPPYLVAFGLDQAGLGSLEKMERKQGLRAAFGFKRASVPPLPPWLDITIEDETDPVLRRPFETNFMTRTRAGSYFAAASIYEELTAEGMAPRGWDTEIFDGDLGDTPLYLIAPCVSTEAQAYVDMVATTDVDRERFARMLKNIRDKYLSASSVSERVCAPDNSGHNFLYSQPDYLVPEMRRILDGLAKDRTGAGLDYRTLTRWPGPYGGLPPVDEVTPEKLQTVYTAALQNMRVELEAIAASSEAPSFGNTILALERAGRDRNRVQSLHQIFTSVVGGEDYAAVAASMAPLQAEIDSILNLDARLFARVSAVHASENRDLSDMDRRLVEVIHARMQHKGAGLGEDDKVVLKSLNAEIAELFARFNANTAREARDSAVFFEAAADLAGLSDAQMQQARDAAARLGFPNRWAIPIAYPTVSPVLKYGRNREARRRVYTGWIMRGGNPGETDNRPLIDRIVTLRGQKARLLGYDNFADYQTSARMVGSPDVPLDLLRQTWDTLVGEARELEAELTELARVDGLEGPLQTWDYAYYREKLRTQKYDFDMRDVQPYLSMENVVAAMFGVADQAYGFTFRELDDVPVVDPTVRVFEASLDGKVRGVLYMDLYQRDGKAPASFASSFRSAETFDGPVMPVVALYSATPVPLDGEPTLLTYERAKVIFHEFGHTLHTLANAAPYPSLGTYTLPWDYIEVASLFHERWFRDRAVLARYMRHYETGDAIPDEMLDRLETVNIFDRGTSLMLDFLGVAIFDLELYQRADGAPVDVMAVEREVLNALDMPGSRDLIMRAPHAFHVYSPQYASSVYTYYWSDALAADIASAFMEAEAGMSDPEMTRRYRRFILDAANTMSASDAFAAFRGRDPDPAALLREYGLTINAEILE
ncbi:MAG: alpha/beta fold hydrolase [Pseudomonadota bacterium]